MEYKGYKARVEFDAGADILHGQIIGTRDIITFQATSIEDLHKAFRDSLDDYLDFFAERGEKPEKPFSGKFMVRLSPELHRLTAMAAEKTGKSLNNWVVDQLDRDARQILK